ncbi:MAG TPA: Hsp33 family molecular chaperone HslO [Balneolales bacterium]|nr:Hsp33 family molecular chaperone HslO [Balneolales bacterium]
MISKEDFLRKDRIIKGITGDGNFKISVVKTTEVVKDAQRRHNLSLLNTVILGRALTGVMLMASELKGEERIQLRIQGNGPIEMLIAEANSVGEIRGYVANPDAELDYLNKEINLGEGLGIGVLTFSKILYNEAKPLTGIVTLQSGNISDDLAHYLMQSEQVRSGVVLDVQIGPEGNVSDAGGILIQAMPSSEEKQRIKIEDHLKTLPPVGTLLSKGEYIDDLMKRAVAPFEVKELSRYPVHFFCRCNRDRFLDALASLGYEDLKAISGEGQELVCHYCNEHYHISESEIDEIIRDMKIKMN